MGWLTVALICLFLVCMGRGLWAANCQSSGFGGCECNILGACDSTGNNVPGLDNKLTDYAPSGIEQFGYKKDGINTNLAYLCENNTVAILYDCNARIPLYSATVMTDAHLKASYKRIDVSFKKSSKLKLEHQQRPSDYVQSNRRHLCYENGTSSEYFVDKDWFEAAEPGHHVAMNQECCSPYVQTTPIHQGHLIAASYGRGDQVRQKATFTYTNVVPQFSVFNSGGWNAAEKKVVDWGRDKCTKHNGKATQNAWMNIVVGAIPSTYDTFQPRFFGQSGFSDYQNKSQLKDTYGPSTGEGEYRVNVPRYMWTAVCCTFRYKDAHSQWKDGVESSAFFRENEPSHKPVNYTSIFNDFNVTTVQIFPKEPRCNM